MFNLLAANALVNYFRAYFELVGTPGIIAAILFFVLLVTCSLSRKGVHFLFLLFLMASMLSASGKEAAARTAAISVFRYMLLFPIAFWGLLSLLSHKKKVGLTGWFLLLYCFLHVPGWLQNNLVGTARLLGQFLLWFAVVGFLSAELTNIDRLKQFLKSMGWMSWVLVAIAGIFALVFPGESFAGGRFQSLWARPNSFAISMFFVVLVLAYRTFLMDKNSFRLVDIACLFAAMVMILMSGTRAAGVAAAVVLLPFIKGKSLKYYVLTFVVFILFLGVILSVPSLKEMAVERFVPTSEMDTAGRAERWSYGWQFALEKSVFGHGLDETLEVNAAGSHNSFVAIAIVGGMTTLSVFIAVCIMAVLSAVGKARLQYSVTDRKLCYHILFSVLAVLFICFFESIAIGIGGAGITIIWLIFQCVNGLAPAPQEESTLWLENHDYDVAYGEETGFDLRGYSYNE